MYSAIVLCVIVKTFSSINCDVIDLLGHSYSHFFPQVSHVHFPQIFTTTTSLPEIIINRQARPFDPRSNRNGGYFLDRPSIPFNPTQPPQLDNEYLPPSQKPPLNEYLPPPSQIPTTEIPTRDEEVPVDDGYHYDPPDNSYIPPASGSYVQRNGKEINLFRSSTNSINNVRAELKDLKCLQNPNGYFKAQLQIHNNVDTFPVVEQDISDPRCEIKTLRTQSLITIVSDDFSRCGVYSCGSDLCLRVRFPLIRGLKTKDDFIMTLQCKVQERVVGKTHAIRLSVGNGVRGRSNGGTVAHGGGSQQFRTQIGLFRRVDDNGFSQALQPGDSVQMGEELMLRAQARAGDGWNYTRISDVVLQRFSPQGELLNSVNLISPTGCLNTLMRSVCPQEPIFEQPLGYRFGFRAFMFQGMKSGDEMVLNVKMNGCLYRKDCNLDVKCDTNRQVIRSKRDTANKTEEKIETTHLSFRVIESPTVQNEFNKFNYTLNSYQLSTITVSSLIIVVGGLILIVHFIKNCKRYKTLT